VVREFVPSEPRDSDVILLAFEVLALDLEMLASGEEPDVHSIGEGMGFEVGQRVARLEPTLADVDINLEAVPVDTIGDWTIAQLHDSLGDGLDVGILVLGDGPVIRSALGASTGGNILANLEDIARVWLQTDASTPADGEPESLRTEGLWAELPGPAHLAAVGQFSVDREWVHVTGPAVAGGVQAELGTVSVGTRENPIPLGTPVRLSDGWTITVNSVVPDATAQILAANSLNDPPEPGTQFLMANISATYEGPDSDSFNGSYRLRTVGPSSVSYSTFENSCGVVPDDLTDAEVFTGGTITGNICWAIEASDAEALVMYDDPLTFEEVERVFLALTE
jgi:hypothetical protein